MKIAWLTPFDGRSAIARFSRVVTEALAKFAQVDIWHEATSEPYATALRTFPYLASQPPAPAAIREYDIAVYNLGDHLPNHREIFHLSQKVPGIVIPHDFVMHHFFAGHYLLDRQSPDEYCAAMVRLYGSEVERLASNSAFREPRIWDSDEVTKYPFFEDCLRGALGVAVHSQFFYEKVARVFEGPVRKLFLAYDAGSEAPASYTRQQLKIGSGKLLALTIGFVNPNKRILPVIEAIGKNPELKDKYIYAVIGACQPRYAAELNAAIKKYGLEDTVRLLGYLPDEQLYTYLAHSDICINLRYPAMEGASASVIEEMLHGKPIVVTDTGFYSELPDETVCKIDPANEARDLERILTRFMRDPGYGKAMGGSARKYASAKADPGIYAIGLMELIQEVMDAAPLMRFTDRMARLMATIGVTSDMPLAGTIAQTTFEMFCEADRNGRPRLPNSNS